jgi:hypothetical protein
MRHRRSRGKTPSDLNHDTRWTRFTPYPLDNSLFLPQSLSGDFGVEKTLFALTGNRMTLSRSIRALVTIPTELSGLPTPTSFYITMLKIYNTYRNGLRIQCVVM